jgi:hypothetical protein
VTENVAEPYDTRVVWVTTGLWLATSRGGLHILNALDENGLAAQPLLRDTDHDWRPI